MYLDKRWFFIFSKAAKTRSYFSVVRYFSRACSELRRNLSAGFFSIHSNLIARLMVFLRTSKTRFARVKAYARKQNVAQQAAARRVFALHPRRRSTVEEIEVRKGGAEKRQKGGGRKSRSKPKVVIRAGCSMTWPAASFRGKLILRFEWRSAAWTRAFEPFVFICEPVISSFADWFPIPKVPIWISDV